ncbi:amidohydrolase family domain-containing protein [Trichoderma breve]|uniref:Amidohydrolase family domain-containing protein n=1 Tax=Trichoderma breve TaxID=2034170 RepID=A0A9W9E650_9HYPO|nr:amidohydrolase family domain-containing protein [Trichoderma breve]KAJ4857992.1 amidohydrolase family domain-containing protein [Trichoderma breve]
MYFTLLAGVLLFAGFGSACFPSGHAAKYLVGWAPPLIKPEIRQVSRPIHNKIAINNVRIFDGYEIGELTTVVIDGDVIGTDASGADCVDGLGGVLLPGLIDSHCHPLTLEHLGQMSSYGVTTAIGMGCSPEPACNTLRNQTGLTDFYSAGEIATSPNSTHATPPTGPPDLISNANQAQEWVNQRIGNGSDFIKLIAEANGMTQAEHNAIVYQAHQAGKQSTTHASDIASYKQAVISKTDIIQHSVSDLLLPVDLVKQIIANNQTVTPTLTVARVVNANPLFNPSGNGSFHNATLNASIMHKAGIPILVGTDSNLLNAGINVAYGSSVHDELENLVSAGMTPAEVLRSATVLPARQFGLNDRGIIAPGFRADLLLIQGNPLQNISTTRNILRVWNAGLEYTLV